MVKVYGYYKRSSNKNDYKGFGSLSGVKTAVEMLMRDSDISTIIIENPENNHRFKYDASGEKKFRCIGTPGVVFKGTDLLNHPGFNSNIFKK